MLQRVDCLSGGSMQETLAVIGVDVIRVTLNRYPEILAGFVEFPPQY